MAALSTAVAELEIVRPADQLPFHSGLPGGGPQPARARSVRRWLWIAAILIVGCLAYGRVVTDYFVMDDFELLTRASRTPWWGAFHAWESREGVPCYWLAPENPNPERSPEYFRPLEGLVYWGNYHAWGMWALPYHLFALLLNLGICLLVFRIARHFIRRIEFAGIAALLFAAHPAHVEVVQWVAALSDPLAALFSLLAFDAWMTQRSDARGRWSVGMSLGCFGLALLCKESAVMVPALLLLAEMWVPRKSPAPKWR